MKKLFTILLVLALALCLSAGAFAADDHIINESGSDMENFSVSYTHLTLPTMAVV